MELAVVSCPRSIGSRQQLLRRRRALSVSARGMPESSRAHQLMGGRWTHTGIVALLVSRESCALGAAEPGTSSVVDSWAQLAKVNQLP